MHCDPLEPRVLFAKAVPTVFEQYFLELVNRARANPVEEAERFGIDLNEGLPTGTLTDEARQPLAINRNIQAAARKYSRNLLDPTNPSDGQLTHNLNGTNPGGRAQAAGYPNTNVGENLVFNTATGEKSSIADVERAHELLFKDFTDTFEVEGRGHRKNIVNATYKEVGIGIAIGPFGGHNGHVGTQDFGVDRGVTFLTGVVYNDEKADDNDFYTPGEGLKKITIRATRNDDGEVFKTKTWKAGGYTLALPAGTYTVTAAGKGLGGKQTFLNVVIDDANLKLDVTRPGDKDKSRPLVQSVQVEDVKDPIQTEQTFTVTYRDNDQLRRKSIGDGDIRVVNEDGFKVKATLVSKTAKGPSIAATYRIDSPVEQGTYSLYLVKGEVKDGAGKACKAQQIGSFDVLVSPFGSSPSRSRLFDFDSLMPFNTASAIEDASDDLLSR